MADIISIDNKLQLAENKKAALIRKRKILTVQKVFHCTHCASKCAKCGTQIGVGRRDRKHDLKLRVPYRFCESCSEEYIDYIEQLKGGEIPTVTGTMKPGVIYGKIGLITRVQLTVI